MKKRAIAAFSCAAAAAAVFLAWRFGAFAPPVGASCPAKAAKAAAGSSEVFEVTLRDSRLGGTAFDLPDDEAAVMAGCIDRAVKGGVIMTRSVWIEDKVASLIPAAYESAPAGGMDVMLDLTTLRLLYRLTPNDIVKDGVDIHDFKSSCVYTVSDETLKKQLSAETSRKLLTPASARDIDLGGLRGKKAFAFAAVDDVYSGDTGRSGLSDGEAEKLAALAASARDVERLPSGGPDVPGEPELLVAYDGSGDMPRKGEARPAYAAVIFSDHAGVAIYAADGSAFVIFDSELYDYMRSLIK